MAFRILGAREVLAGGRADRARREQTWALLAVFLLHANQALMSDRLIDKPWGERAAPAAAMAVHVHVSRLRKALVSGEGDGGRGPSGHGARLRAATGPRAPRLAAVRATQRRGEEELAE